MSHVSFAQRRGSFFALFDKSGVTRAGVAEDGMEPLQARFCPAGGVFVFVFREMEENFRQQTVADVFLFLFVSCKTPSAQQPITTAMPCLPCSPPRVGSFATAFLPFAVLPCLYSL